jgi:hypothetical protein
MLELPPIEQIEFFPSSLHLSVSTECLHPCHMGKVQGVPNRNGERHMFYL